MITTEQTQELISALIPHTITSVRNTELYNIPIVVNAKEEDMPGALTKCIITNEKYFHLNDKWYSYKFSADEPQFTFGILKVTNMPYTDFEGKRNNRSFLCTMHDLLYQGYCEPFMLFVNRKFVNWDIINIVFDCDNTYLLLYGEEYNWYNLNNAEFHMVILPFKTEYIGIESDSHFNMMYDITKLYIQESLTTNNGKIIITIPGISEIYEYRGMVYNIGAWIYTQLKYEYLGLLSDDRIAKLKKIDVVKYEYDNAGNAINTLITKFNALDKDSYNMDLYNKICYMDKSIYESEALFRFNDDGVLDGTGNNIIVKVNDDILHYSYESSEEKIIHTESRIDNVLFRENYLIFKDGYFYPECGIKMGVANTTLINNPDNNLFGVHIFYHSKTSQVITHTNYFNQEALSDMITSIFQGVENPKYGINGYLPDNTIKQVDVIEPEDLLPTATFPQTVIWMDYEDAIKEKYLSMMLEYLDYNYLNSLSYNVNSNNGLKAIMKFNPLLLNDLYHTNIESTVITGKRANASLDLPLHYESRRGLKIPRNRYENHESYVLVFEDGELIKEYWNMVAYPNFFFIPMGRSFNNNSQIELLYFNNVDNNELEFNLTQFMVDNMETKDAKWIGTDIFNQFIRTEDLKVFCKYPEDILIYKDLIPQSDNIAFNISFRDDNNDLYLIKSVVNKALGKTDEANKFVAVSSRKFIYQRLRVDQKSYRIEIDQRFMYCDNQKQYVLFINGRRMNDESFLITIPKYTRPFWGMYLYVAKFVGPEDRIELLYLPDELVDLNMGKEDDSLNINGYIEYNRNTLAVPFDPRLYLLFVNGKKIPPTNIKTVDSHTFRITKDTLSTRNLIINPIYTDTLPAVKNYFASGSYSSYDNIISLIKHSENLGYAELDKLFKIFVKMSNTEVDKTKQNVARIAILNEIIRDFWVTSGYQYNENPFIYDYQIDGYIYTDRNNSILPSLDANQYINIIKNDAHLLYFNHTPEEEYYEIGSSINGMKFFWEFAQNLYTELNIYYQKIGYRLSSDDEFIIESIDIDERKWEYSDIITEDTTFKFSAGVGSNLIEQVTNIRFANGIYYGVLDEDMLQYLTRTEVGNGLDNIIALIPKNGIVPSTNELLEENDASLKALSQYNYIIEDLTSFNTTYTVIDDDIVMINDPYLVAICLDGTVFNNGLNATEDGYIIAENSTPLDLQYILPNIDCIYQPSPELYLNDYVIGNNNYFIYACPKRLAYNENDELLIKFIMPDPKSDDIKANCRDDHTTPIYTSGSWDIKHSNLLESLDEMSMTYFGEFEYTNNSGYTETYCLWRSNGFFTRLFEDYGFHIEVRYKDTYRSELDEINTIEEEVSTMSISENESIESVEVNATEQEVVANEQSESETKENIIMLDEFMIL